MVDTAEVYGLAVKTWNEDTASYDLVAPLVHTGLCRIRVADTLVQEIEAQSQPLIVGRLTVSFPVAAETVFPENFTIKITASPFDQTNVGRTFRIQGPHAQTLATAHRYPVEETT